jgi:hypothetical protein
MFINIRYVSIPLEEVHSRNPSNDEIISVVSLNLNFYFFSNKLLILQSFFGYFPVG